MLSIVPHCASLWWPILGRAVKQELLSFLTAIKKITAHFLIIWSFPAELIEVAAFQHQQVHDSTGTFTVDIFPSNDRAKLWIKRSLCSVSEVCPCITDYSSTHHILFQLHVGFVNQLKRGRHSSYNEVIISHLFSNYCCCSILAE